MLVAAPTGSGKTVVAEHAVARALAEGGKAFYTTPIKALSNQKFADLARRHGARNVGLLTGDNSINGDAPVVVMTTEVLRNMIYARSPALDGLRFVVLDEVHYLQDTYRGPVWEEVIIHLPASVALVCLSATVSNAEELADWLTTVRGPTRLVLEERRPVELRNLYLVGDRQSEQPHLLPTLVDGHPNREADRLDDEVVRQRGGRQRGNRRPRRRLFTPRRPEVVEMLDERDMLPALYFIFSRMGCEEAVASCLDAGLRLTTPDERTRIRAIVDEHTAALSDDDLDVLGYDRWAAALEMGLAAHHAGHGPAVQGGGRGVLRRGPGEGGVRHRDAGPRRQHAGPLGRHRAADEVHRRGPRLPDAGRVHPAHRPGGAPGHRRPRLRDRALVAVRAVRPGGVAGVEPDLRPALRLPAHLQHGRQPGAPLRAARGPPPAEPVVRPVPGRQGGRAVRGPHRAPGGAPRRARAWTRSASGATSATTGRSCRPSGPPTRPRRPRGVRSPSRWPA